MTRSKRDANERAIIAGLNYIGVFCCQMHREAGFDLLLGFRGRLYAVEIKDPAQPPSQRKLTTGEQLTAARLALATVPYHVCTTLDEVLAVIGAI